MIGNVFAVSAASEASAETSAETASEASVENTVNVSAPIYLSGIVSDSESCSAERTLLLDYPSGTVTESIRLNNAGEKDAVIDILAPQAVTLSAAESSLYTITGENTDVTRYTTNLFILSDLSETTVTAESLAAEKTRPDAIPELDGHCYEISGAPSGDEPFMTFTKLTENCHIFHYGCKYTVKEDVYSLFMNDGVIECTLFLTGEADKDFTASFAEGISVNDRVISTYDYFSACCDRYFAETGTTGITTELMLRSLSGYFSRSTGIPPMEIPPTLSYITAQKLFAVDDAAVTLKPGESTVVTVSRPAQLDPSQTQISSVLVEGSIEGSQTVKVVFPEGYSTLAVQKTSGKKEAGDSYHITGYKDKVFKVVIYKSFDFSSTLKHLPLFMGIMVVFMGLCLFSYMNKRKQEKK